MKRPNGASLKRARPGLTETIPRFKRRSQCTPELVEALAEKVAAGMPLRYAAAALGVASSTVTYWMKRPEFEAAIERGRARFVERQLSVIERAANNMCKNGYVQWQAAAWLLERSMPDAFAFQTKKPAGAQFVLNVRLSSGEQVQVGVATASEPAAIPTSSTTDDAGSS